MCGGCCCCCKDEPSQHPRLSAAPGRHDVIVSPIFGPITTQPPPSAATSIHLPTITTVTTQPPQSAVKTIQLPTTTTFTMQSTTVSNISGKVPTITRITMQLPAVDYVTQQSGITTITTHSPMTANSTSSPHVIIADNSLQTPETLPADAPPRRPGSSMAAPSAPPPPGATEHYWAKAALSHTEPAVALAAGLYVGRAVSGAHTLPAIVETALLADPRSGVAVERFAAANFFYKDLAGCTDDFEVLACSRTSWRSALGGHVAPEGAIVCGRTPSGRPLYMGRVFDEGSYHYGTADPEEGVLFCVARADCWYACVRTSDRFDILVGA